GRGAVPGARQRRDPRRRADPQPGARLHQAYARLRRPASHRHAKARPGEEHRRRVNTMFDHDETLQQARARNIRDALMEDIGQRDWTAELVPATQRVKARVLAREAAVLCGRHWFDGCLRTLDADAQITWHYAEGGTMRADTP